MRQNPTTLTSRIVNYVKSYKVSLGVLLAAYGAFYLAAVIMGDWTLSTWGKDIPDLPQPEIHALLPRSFISPFFFITSFPALLVGTAMLCVYSIRALRSGITVDSENIAILLTAFGFAYVVVGAWPLGETQNFPWEWQKQIMSYGSSFTWILYLLSLVVLAVGTVSLYVHSRDYHQKYPQRSISP